MPAVWRLILGLPLALVLLDSFFLTNFSESSLSCVLLVDRVSGVDGSSMVSTHAL